MIDCADCQQSITRRIARVYVNSEGTLALTLCQSCQARYRAERQYQPTNLPQRSRISLERSR